MGHDFRRAAAGVGIQDRRIRPVRARRAPLPLAGVGLVTVALVAVVLFAYLGFRSAATPKVTGYQQITKDGIQKTLLGTDGVRVYFAEQAGSASWTSRTFTA